MNTEEFPKWKVNLKNMSIAGDKYLPQNLGRVAMGVVIYDLTLTEFPSETLKGIVANVQLYNKVIPAPL